jgi:hypothetical protein
MQSSFDVNPNSKEVISHAISELMFPFHLKGHQLEAVDAWISSGLRGSIIYSSGTGKTEIAFECARRAANIISSSSSMNILSIYESVRYACNRCGKLIGDHNYTVHIIRHAFDDMKGYESENVIKGAIYDKGN